LSGGTFFTGPVEINFYVPEASKEKTKIDDCSTWKVKSSTMPKTNSSKAQRITTPQEEEGITMSANNKAKKNSNNKKAKAQQENAQVSPRAEGNIGSVPEGQLAVPEASEPLFSEKQDSAIRFCPVCRYYLFVEVSGEDQSLQRLCRNCGHREEDTKGGLVMEMMVQERSAEGYKILLNEFTRQDPRLPHIRKNIKCPEPKCDSNHGKREPDIIYIKYDPINMLYLYICDICGFQWRSAR